MSSHLAHLERAGLLRSWREQRHIFYAVNTEGIRQLVAFLTEDCCGGRPELCGIGPSADACQGQDRAVCETPLEKRSQMMRDRMTLHARLQDIAQE